MQQEDEQLQRNRRKSNEGFRKVDLEERVLIFLFRLRRKTPFQELGFMFGCGESTAADYFWEMVGIFYDRVVPKLLLVRKPEDLRKMSREKVQQAYPSLLYMIDATAWKQDKPENFLYNRMSWSAYKHYNCYQVLFGKNFSGVVVLGRHFSI